MKEEVKEEKSLVTEREESLSEKVVETVAILKKKLAKMHERNKELAAKCKVQAQALAEKSKDAGSKSFEGFKSFLAAFRNFFGSKPREPKVVILDIHDQVLTIYGVPAFERDGLLKITDAHVVEFDFVTSSVVKTISDAGTVYVRMNSVKMFVDYKALASEEGDNG